MRKGAENLIPGRHPENFLLVQLATLMASHMDCEHRAPTSTDLMPRAGSIINLIERRCPEASEGAKLILAFRVGAFVADWFVSQNQLVRIDADLLSIAAEQIQAQDTCTGIDWLALDRVAAKRAAKRSTPPALKRAA